MTFDIIPLKLTKQQSKKKRSMTKAKNSHIIVKREDDLNYTHKTDYMFPPETNAKELENNLFRSIEFFKLFKTPKKY